MKQGDQQVQSQNIMQLPQASERTVQRENFIPLCRRMLYNRLEYKHHKLEFTCFHKTKIFLFNYFRFPQVSGYGPCMVLRLVGGDQYCPENSYMASLPLCLLLPLPPSLPHALGPCFSDLLLVLPGSQSSLRLFLLL